MSPFSLEAKEKRMTSTLYCDCFEIFLSSCHGRKRIPMSRSPDSCNDKDPSTEESCFYGWACASDFYWDYFDGPETKCVDTSRSGKDKNVSCRVLVLCDA